jgi:hypothetical protein
MTSVPFHLRTLCRRSDSSDIHHLLHVAIAKSNRDLMRKFK